FQTSKITIQHILMNTTDEQVDAIESIQKILKDVNFTNNEQIVAFSPDYVSWTANKIIGEELIRNLGLTIGAVSIVTLVLIQNIRTALLVISCVIFTVTDLVAEIKVWYNADNALHALCLASHPVVDKGFGSSLVSALIVLISPWRIFHLPVDSLKSENTIHVPKKKNSLAKNHYIVFNDLGNVVPQEETHLVDLALNHNMD
ncbi:unnamed protein product, partial [Timema podura]|nr:unnamed protein product [Timema podura]